MKGTTQKQQDLKMASTSKINNLKEENGVLTFTITGINVSYVNAIRRTILSDIPIVVFKTSPHSENNATISINTSRLNNEVVKQRLSCIPICITDLDMPLKNYMLEVDVENKTDTSIMATTNDFKIRDLVTNEYLDSGELKKIFPPYIPPNGNEYYIDFLRLRPKLTDEIPGERIKLTCKFTIGTAREDSMFNVTGTCSFGNTPDFEKMEEQLEIQRQAWKDEGKNEKEITFESANWKLLDGLRYVIKNSFDFIIESVGIYENDKLIIKACEILVGRLENLIVVLENNELSIEKSDNTLENSYDVILENEDYTIGNMLNYELYSKFYQDFKLLNYVGFKKLHPHDTYSTLRLSLTDSTKGISSVRSILKGSIIETISNISGIMGCFDGRRGNC
jgi:DNA-directed RNA polymerase subunit L